MVKKSALIVFIGLIIATLLISHIAAQAGGTTEEQKVAKTYDWLIKQVQGKWQTLNIKQHVFSVLALRCNESYFNPGNSSLYAKRFSSQNLSCWGAGPSKPSSQDGCMLTETALAKVALDSWGDNTTKVTKWILSRNMTQVLGINWYLQIDIDRGSNASCEIIYGGNEEKMFEVAADKKVSIVNGTSKCFYTDTTEPYWFKIRADKDCYSYTYTIKCWSNATTYRASLLYKKTGSNIWHVSSQTESGRPGVPGSEKLEDQPNPLELEVISYCLANPIGIGQGCDYEGTAWSAYALATSANTEERERAKMFVPYLVVFSEDNIRFFPSSFLYPITSGERYNTEILAAQKVVGTDKGYWLIQPITYGRVYDTAHAGLALGASGIDAIAKAKNYLISNQGTDGSLVVAGYGESQKEPIRDTAFALWVLWPGLCPGVGVGPGGNCLDLGYDYRCTTNITCNPDEIEIPDAACETGEICCKYIGAGEAECTSAGGACRELCEENETEIETIFCPDFLYCCKAYAESTCDELHGTICDPLLGETCLGEEVESLDGACCLGECSGGTSEENCPDIGTECQSDEVCINKLTWRVVDFTTTPDSKRCCVGGNVKCVPDKSCSSIGAKCLLGEECTGNIVETRDEEECCEGQCLESCNKQGGTICTTDQECSGTMTYSAEFPNQLKCCVNGTCKKPAGLWWIWIIIIVVILGGGAAYYFLVMKKKKGPPKEKVSPFGGPFGGPVIRPVVRPSTPGPGISPRPLFRPQPKPLLKPLAKPVLGPTPSVPATATATKPKGKTESELEKTLSKLKKMSKK
ncbi:MAG: hypothetical protein ACPLXC_00570 [Candidatus Pacearchaeota archaeon]